MRLQSSAMFVFSRFSLRHCIKEKLKNGNASANADSGKRVMIARILQEGQNKGSSKIAFATCSEESRTRIRVVSLSVSLSLSPPPTRAKCSPLYAVSTWLPTSIGNDENDKGAATSASHPYKKESPACSSRSKQLPPACTQSLIVIEWICRCSFGCSEESLP